MRRRESHLIVLILVCAVGINACGSKSPTAPTPPAADFASQFDSLWNTFDREYSYFEHKRIDWHAIRATYRPRALATGDQAAFIDVIREMLGQLHDLHVVIRDPNGRTIPTYDPQSFVNWNRSVWQQYTARANWTSWGTDSGFGVLDGVPYFSFGSWSATNVRTGEFDAAIDRYRSSPAMILDVRMNPGGNDALAFEIVARFTPSTLTFGYVKFRNGPAHSDFGPPTTRTVSPRGGWQYAGRVYVLIGRRCASSNESFILAMSLLPNVTLVGDRTAGATANPGSFPLANGWSYTVSRWIEYTVDNQVIEDNGIMPDVIVPASGADFAQGRDPVIDAAVGIASRSNQ